MQSQLGTQCKPFFRLTTRNPLFRSKKCCILRFTFATILQIGIIATKMYASQRARERKSRRDPARKPERAPKSHRDSLWLSMSLKTLAWLTYKALAGLGTSFLRSSTLSWFAGMQSPFSLQKQQTLTSVNPYLSHLKRWIKISNGDPFSSEVTFSLLSEILLLICPSKFCLTALPSQDSVRVRVCGQKLWTLSEVRFIRREWWDNNLKGMGMVIKFFYLL